jgi:methylglyoxal synthase
VRSPSVTLQLATAGCAALESRGQSDGAPAALRAAPALGKTAEEEEAESGGPGVASGCAREGFGPHEMRCLALVAHNHMKPAMIAFVEKHQAVLKRFRLTGTSTTMKFLKKLFGDDPSVEYGPTCSSGPLGGDAQVAAQMALEDLGGILFFVDPLSAHPHQADIESLARLANVHNVLLATNPATASLLIHAIADALQARDEHRLKTFFKTEPSPCVAEYQLQQAMLFGASAAADRKAVVQHETRGAGRIVSVDMDDPRGNGCSGPSYPSVRVQRPILPALYP